MTKKMFDRVAYNKTYHQVHKAEIKASQKACYRRVKLKALTYYSTADCPKCAHCGIDDIDVLCIDHINNDGAKQRKVMGWGRKAGSVVYYWLRKNNYPEGYQVLCWNCNHKKRLKYLDEEED